MKRKSLLVGTLLTIITLSMFMAAYSIMYAMMMELSDALNAGSVVFDEHMIMVIIPSGVALVGILFASFSLAAGFKENAKFSKWKWLVIVTIVINVLLMGFFVYKAIVLREALHLMILYIAAAVAMLLASIFLFGSCFYSKKNNKK